MSDVSTRLMAPCGMNCGICMAYLRPKNKCPGCRFLNESSKVTCLRCKIRSCQVLKSSQFSFCGDCKDFPCVKIVKIDKRYRTKYGMSMIDNLAKIKKLGVDQFMKIENTRWVCKKCGGQICIHNKKCYNCED